jgi:5-methylcytosine-specific restriction enzyme A
MTARKVCSHVDSRGGCPNLQPCPDHERKPWAGSNRRHELPPDWDRRRRTVLARDPICKCGNALSTEVHHIGDPHDHSLDELEGICAQCHREETQRQAQAARRARGDANA